jgi:ATP-dependent DNA ligase
MPLLSFIEPCLPSLADRLPDGPDWVHEIKHDGYRLMAAGRRPPFACAARDGDRCARLTGRAPVLEPLWPFFL